MPPRKRDYRGRPIPLKLQETFASSDAALTYVRSLQAAVTKIGKLHGLPGLELIDLDEAANAAAYVRNLIDQWRPFMVCEDCRGVTPIRGVCPFCEGRGWLPLAKARKGIRYKREKRLRWRRNAPSQQ